MNNQPIGRALRVLRIYQSLSTIQVADAVGICEKTYRKYENDLTYPPQDKILTLAKFYDIKPMELQYGKMIIRFEEVLGK